MTTKIPTATRQPCPAQIVTKTSKKYFTEQSIPVFEPQIWNKKPKFIKRHFKAILFIQKYTKQNHIFHNSYPWKNTLRGIKTTSLNTPIKFIEPNNRTTSKQPTLSSNTTSKHEGYWFYVNYINRSWFRFHVTLTFVIKSPFWSTFTNKHYTTQNLPTRKTMQIHWRKSQKTNKQCNKK